MGRIAKVHLEQVLGYIHNCIFKLFKIGFEYEYEYHMVRKSQEITAEY